MRARLRSWLGGYLRDWAAPVGLVIAVAGTVIMVTVIWSSCARGTACPSWWPDSWRSFPFGPVLWITALGFLPGMWLWKAERFAHDSGAGYQSAPFAGLVFVPWVTVMVVVGLLVVVAAVAYECLVSGETWVNAATWRLTRRKVHEDGTGVLYQGMTSWGPVLKVCVTDANGDHWLTVKDAKTAREAVASTFGLKAEEYAPAVQS